jgi:hypothetical protein
MFCLDELKSVILSYETPDDFDMDHYMIYYNFRQHDRILPDNYITPWYYRTLYYHVETEYINYCLQLQLKLI